MDDDFGKKFDKKFDEKFDEKEVFSGLAAQHWAAISDTDPRVDQEYYRGVIRRQGGPALELGCGAGRLLLAYLGEGLDVAGCDISADILDQCRAAGAAAGLAPVLYEQAMQDLDVPGAFATIYIPCGSFVCVMDRDAALETLRRCQAHLAPGGVLTFNVYLAGHDYSQPFVEFDNSGEWLFKAEKKLPRGQRLIVSYRETGLDPIEQIWMEDRKYELYDGNRLLQTEVRGGQGRWYFRNELLWMLRLAGFGDDVTVTGDYTDQPYGAQHTQSMVFTATKKRA